MAKVIKRIGAWVSLVSIISIMAGSTLNKETKTEEVEESGSIVNHVFLDMNNDNNPDYIYLSKRDQGWSSNWNYNEYDLFVRYWSNYEFGKPKRIDSFESKDPIEFKVKDVNKDRSLDLIYLIKGDVHWGYFGYDKFQRLGDGKGNFKEKELVEIFEGKPESW